LSDKSSIEWTDATWNPLRARFTDDAGTALTGWHCVHISDGCRNCYAERINKRLGTGLPYSQLAGTRVEHYLDEKALTTPLRWKKPRKIFVCSMSDLFGAWATDRQIDQIFAVMAACPQHTFQILTKRSERMQWWLQTNRVVGGRYIWEAQDRLGIGRVKPGTGGIWPLANVWCGVSVESQRHLERIDDLKDTLAAVRFVSFEPLLEDLGALILDGIHWAIVGGESGPGARPFNIQWARRVLEDCARAGVPCFVKQLGAKPFLHAHADVQQHRLKDRKGGAIEEWPADLRVREFPRVAVTA
jgi:protein gp37